MPDSSAEAVTPPGFIRLTLKDDNSLFVAVPRITNFSAHEATGHPRGNANARICSLGDIDYVQQTVAEIAELIAEAGADKRMYPGLEDHLDRV
ncbi:hypothetical protein LCGC14_1709830 [marine sediment metagenome]|uniref:Uncharacterized protein n=1 Tax=marine sediment metagenome TaxID=412755 RepID=A0A0F9HF64_9ZZZZ